MEVLFTILRLFTCAKLNILPYNMLNPIWIRKTRESPSFSNFKEYNLYSIRSHTPHNRLKNHCICF